MKKGWWNRWKLWISDWMEEPLGEAPTLTEPETPIKKPIRLSSRSSWKAKPIGPVGSKKKKASFIPEFHPRGSAGHREIYAPRPHHKAALPYAGKGVKHPK